MVKTRIFQKLQIAFAPLLLLAVFISFGSPAFVSADPVPSCNPPAVLKTPTDGNPPYCACPTGKVVVVSSTGSKCASKCPAGTIGTKGAANQTYCNTPVDTNTSSDGYVAAQQKPLGTYYCGDPTLKSVNTSIDLGCKGKGDPIMDLLFAIIRFLSYGIGLVIVGSLTYAGIQYTASRGDPNAHAMAVKRIQANVTALLIFVFAFALVNYVVPGQVLK